MNEESFFKEHYLNIDVILGHRTLKIKQLKNLHVGSVIELDKLAGEPLEVLVDNEYYALCEAVVIDENFGVRIIELLNEAEQTQSSNEKTEVENNDNDSKPSCTPCDIDEVLSDIANSKGNETSFFSSVITNTEKPSKEVTALINENNKTIEEHKREQIQAENSEAVLSDADILTNHPPLQKKDGNEVLSQEEIDQLLTAISSGDSEADDFRPVNSTRKILIYDFKHPVEFDKKTIQKFGAFLLKCCSVLPSVLGQHLIFKLDSIVQIAKRNCYNKEKTSFIDQWTWYSSDNCVEISIDDFVIKHVAGIIKQEDFYSQNELSEIATEISSPLVIFLLKAVKQYSENSNIPQLNHMLAVPSPQFLLNQSEIDETKCDCYKLDYSKGNSSMYTSFKIKVLSLSEPDSCGYIKLNVPNDDLRNFINTDNYDEDDDKPYLDNIRISTDVLFGTTRKSISDIMGFGEGTIIELDRITGEPATFRANGTPIAVGEIIVINEWFAIKITELL